MIGIYIKELHIQVLKITLTQYSLVFFRVLHQILYVYLHKLKEIM